ALPGGIVAVAAPDGLCLAGAAAATAHDLRASGRGRVVFAAVEAGRAQAAGALGAAAAAATVGHQHGALDHVHDGRFQADEAAAAAAAAAGLVAAAAAAAAATRGLHHSADRDAP